LAVFFDEVKSNPNINVAIEYEGDVYLQYKTEVYVRIWQNFTPFKAYFTTKNKK